MGKISAAKNVKYGEEAGKVVGVRLKTWHPLSEWPVPEVNKQFYSDNTHRLLCFFGGYGTSKSHTGAHWVVKKLLTNHNVGGGVIGPTMSHIERVMIPAILLVLKDCWEVVYESGKTGPIPYKLNKSSSNMRLDIPLCGSWVEFTYADKDNLKGQNWRWAWGDEPGLWDEDVWPSLLARVRVRTTKDEVARTGASLQIALTGTPEGYNWLYYQTVGKDSNVGCETGEHPRTRVWYASTRNAPWITEETLEQLMEDYPADLIEEKIEGKFLPAGKGRAYTFDRRKHVKPCEFDPAYPLTFTMDWGVAPIVAVVQQTRPDPADAKKLCVYALDEIHFERGSINDVVTKLVARWGHRVKDVTTGEQRFRVICRGDATGKAKHATGVASWEDFYERLGSYGIAYTAGQLDSNPPVSDRVAVMNALLDRGRYFVNPQCKHLIRSLESTYWDEAHLGRKLEKKPGADPSHLSDAATYDVFGTFGHSRLEFGAGLTGHTQAVGLDKWMARADDDPDAKQKPKKQRARPV